MVVVDILEAEIQLPHLIRRALDGERIVIARSGEPLVELTPYRQPSKRIGSLWQGQVRIAEDFDEPLADLERAIYRDYGSG